LRVTPKEIVVFEKEEKIVVFEKEEEIVVLEKKKNVALGKEKEIVVCALCPKYRLVRQSFL
jgi:hypothetical protein